METFKAEESKVLPVHGLDLLKLQIEEPLRWVDSYDMYGERTKAGKSGDPSDFDNYGVFKAKCKLCNKFSQQSKRPEQAKYFHFVHCSREHGYIFDEEQQFKTEDETLQQVIIASQLYGLPLPGYEDHEKCIKQHREGKIVCAVHEGNEYVEKFWLGYI